VRLTITSSAIFVLTLSVLIADAPEGFAQDRRTAAPGGSDPVTIVACVVREADYVRSTAPEASGATAPQLLLANAQSGTPTYSLTGVREAELTQQVGQRVEISGTVEPARTTPVLTTADGTRTGSVKAETVGAAGVTPDGAAAHEPSDAVATTVQAGKVTEPANKAGDPAYQVATLPRLNATSFRRVAGTCATPPKETTASVAPAGTQVAPASTSSSPSPVSQAITARGCLVRQTQDGTALTAQSTAIDSLVLTKASMSDSRPGAVISAVPGSAPSGNGSGTVPNAVATTGAAPVDNGSLAFRLAAAGKIAELTQHVGERVEVVGTIQEEPRPVAEAAGAATTGRAQPAASNVAHPSAPAKVITVTTFRALGGSCN
jgi:hypothetical protein